MSENETSRASMDDKFEIKFEGINPTAHEPEPPGRGIREFFEEWCMSVIREREVKSAPLIPRIQFDVTDSSGCTVNVTYTEEQVKELASIVIANLEESKKATREEVVLMDIEIDGVLQEAPLLITLLDEFMDKCRASYFEAVRERILNLPVPVFTTVYPTDDETLERIGRTLTAINNVINYTSEQSDVLINPESKEIK